MIKVDRFPDTLLDRQIDEIVREFNSLRALPVHANNAAAIAGGLRAGDFYRTGGDPDPVCIVH